MAQMQIRGNTQIIAGTITNTEISASAAIASSKLADGANFLKKDGSVAMTGNFNANSNRIINVTDPSSAQDAATKNYVDTGIASLSSGVQWKQSVRAIAISNITLSGTQTIDGVALSAGDRVLCIGQSTASANGIYVVAAGAWSRASDADASAEVKAGMTCWVNEGTTYADTQWTLTTNDAITLGTTSLTFTQTSGLGQVSAGAGLTKTGNTLNIGAGDGIQVDADSITTKLDGTTIQKSASGLKVNANLSLASVNLENGVESVSITNSGGTKSSDIKFTPTEGSSYAFTIVSEFLSAARSYTLPDRTGTLALAGDFVAETPSGSINGSNTAFTLTTTYSFVDLYLNGILLRSGAGNDYTISGANITMLYAPATGDFLTARCRK